MLNGGRVSPSYSTAVLCCLIGKKVSLLQKMTRARDSFSNDRRIVVFGRQKPRLTFSGYCSGCCPNLIEIEQDPGDELGVLPRSMRG